MSWAASDEEVVCGWSTLRCNKPEATREVALGVKIDDEHLMPGMGEFRCKIEHGCRLPYATLLVGADNDLRPAEVPWLDDLSHGGSVAGGAHTSQRHVSRGTGVS